MMFDDVLCRYVTYGYDSDVTHGSSDSVIDNMDFSIVPQSTPSFPDEVRPAFLTRYAQLS